MNYNRIDDEWEATTGVITTAAEEVLGFIPRTKAKEWFDEELEMATAEKNKAYSNMLQKCNTRRNTDI
ncbi:hypothetical protein ANN_18573 [Periplaneta americana]|uniref:Per a allergen n=1 Tax=Periplaneta americana TaxID=6978 RepID=A0ABQ8SQE3_PERAM|nr:hypothetical protein ANN_18573 [Periplaneta americana]